MVIAVRGAITVEKNDREQILNATETMITELIHRNNLREKDLISLIFTVTFDLDQAFPAEAARRCGITNTPLMCATEIPVPKSLPKCIRVLVHCHSELDKSDISHVYLGKATTLRHDLVKDD